MAYAIQHTLPHRLERASVFEDSTKHLALALGNDMENLEHVENYPAACPILTIAFASKSFELENLLLSYMVDAQTFLNAFQPSNSWHQLLSVALTTSDLEETTSL